MLQKKFKKLIKNYYGEKLVDKIEYNQTDKVVGSTHIAPLIINQGYPAGTFPNFDAIVEWVTTTKDGGKNKRESEWKIKKMAYAVAKKIEQEGIPPRWYVDKVLARMEGI